MTSQRQWKLWGAAGHRPKDIPCDPVGVYTEWAGWEDFLGYVAIYDRDKVPPFEAARAFARKLGLEGQDKWKEWRRGRVRTMLHEGEMMHLPYNPEKTYAGKGWVNYPDWMGYPPKRVRGMHLPFEKALAEVRKMKFKNRDEYRSWRGGTRPVTIPAAPNASYPEQWVSWAHWLGITGPRNRYKRKAGDVQAKKEREAAAAAAAKKGQQATKASASSIHKLKPKKKVKRRLR